MLEAALSKKIVGRLRSRGAWAVKIVGGPRQRAGLPDIFCCYRGVFVAFEVKRPGRERTLTPAQSATLRNIRRARGDAHMVTTVDEALNVLDALDDELGDDE